MYSLMNYCKIIKSYIYTWNQGIAPSRPLQKALHESHLNYQTVTTTLTMTETLVGLPSGLSTKCASLDSKGFSFAHFKIHISFNPLLTHRISPHSILPSEEARIETSLVVHWVRHDCYCRGPGFNSSQESVPHATMKTRPRQMNF